MDGSGELLIRMEGIEKVFLTEEVETHALAGVHLEVKKGEYVSIAGPSGCGKSTLLSIMGLLDSPSGGEYFLNGQPVAGLSFSQRTRLRNREDRIHLPKLQPDRRSQRLRKRGVAADLSKSESP